VETQYLSVSFLLYDSYAMGQGDAEPADGTGRQEGTPGQRETMVFGMMHTISWWS